MRTVERYEITKKQSVLYKKFADSITRIGSFQLTEFVELIGVLKGIDITSDDDFYYDLKK